MSTNPRTATQYRSPTTPSQADTPSAGATDATNDARPAASASAQAPRTFEPANTGELPPMFETEARQDQR